MGNISKQIRRILDLLIISILSVLIIIITIGAAWQVISRYVLGDPSVFTEELLRFMLIWITFLGAAYVFGIKKHLAITYFKNKIKLKGREVVDTAIDVIIILFIGIVLIKGGYNLSVSTLKQLSSILLVPMGYVYMIIPISGVIIVIYQLLNLIDRKLTNRTVRTLLQCPIISFI